MKLYIETVGAIPAIQVLPDGDSTPAGFTESNTVDDWYTHGNKIILKTVRDEFIGDQMSTWTSGPLTDAEKKQLIEYWVWPSGTSDGELDALYTDAERDAFKLKVVVAHREAGCVLTKSTTIASNEYINYTVDDTEVLTTDTILPHQIIK